MYNQNISDVNRQRFFQKQPTKAQLIDVYEIIVKHTQRCKVLENRNTAALSTVQVVDNSIELRKLQKDIDMMKHLYTQLVDCYVMTEEEFAVWQYHNGIIREVKVRPFNPKPVIGDDVDKRLDAMEAEVSAALKIA